MSCDHSRTGCVHSTHTRRRWSLHCAFTAHLLRNVCSAIARRFLWTCSKFDGARSARGICLNAPRRLHCARLTNPQRRWRSLGVCGVSSAYASAVASPASGTGALMSCDEYYGSNEVWKPPRKLVLACVQGFCVHGVRIWNHFEFNMCSITT